MNGETDVKEGEWMSSRWDEKRLEGFGLERWFVPGEGLRLRCRTAQAQHPSDGPLFSL